MEEVDGEVDDRVRVTEVRPGDGRAVHVRFSDGVERTIDLLPALQESRLFNRVRLIDRIFRKVRVSEGGWDIEWPVLGEPMISAGDLYAGLPPTEPPTPEERVEWGSDSAGRKPRRGRPSWGSFKLRYWYGYDGIRGRAIRFLDWWAAWRHDKPATPHTSH